MAKWRGLVKSDIEIVSESQGKINKTARKEAKLKGETKYITGIPCKRGHLAERQTSNGGCVVCNVENDKKYYHQDLDLSRTKNRESLTFWYASIRSDPKKNEEMSKRRAQYRIDNLEKFREQGRRSYQRQPELFKEHSRNRKARNKGAEGKHTQNDILRIFELQKGKCGFCKKSIKQKYHIDHIVALSKGGSNWPKNIQLLCPACNGAKKAKDQIDFMRTLGRLL